MIDAWSADKERPAERASLSVVVDESG